MSSGLTNEETEAINQVTPGIIDAIAHLPLRLKASALLHVITAVGKCLDDPGLALEAAPSGEKLVHPPGPYIPLTPEPDEQKRCGGNGIGCGMDKGHEGECCPF